MISPKFANENGALAWMILETFGAKKPWSRLNQTQFLKEVYDTIKKE